MKSKLFTIFIAACWSISSAASVPTVEGLFRNSHNAEIQGNTAAVSFTIESVQSMEPEKVGGIQALMAPLYEESEDTQDEFEKKTGHYKLIFYVEENRPTPMLQIRYSGVGMAPAEVVDTFVVPNLDAHLQREKILEKQFFYSLVQMFVLNSSAGFNSVFKKEVTDYKSNKDLIDQEKKRLYERYMSYLKKVKESEDEEKSESELESPLKPKDEKERENVEKIMAKRFYSETDDVKLVREGGKFYWEVQLTGLRALFTQEEHRLKEMRLDTLQGALEVNIANYVLMDGTHELPQKVLIDHPEYGRYQVRFLSTQDFESQNTSFSDRVREYRQWQEKNLAQKDEPQKAPLSSIPYMY